MDWKVYFVIDGLEECSRGDVDIVFEEVKRLSTCRTVLFLCSSRPLWEHLREKSILGTNYTIEMEVANRQDEVNAYISRNLKQCRTRYSLSLDSENLIKEQLQLGWGGMYLWLALQMKGILDDLGNGIPAGDILSNLPCDLPSANDNALLRISEKSVASRIFQIIVAAEPSLTVKKLRVAASITPGEVEWSRVAMPSNQTAFLRRYGGHFMEEDENERVRFIHYSAVQHLFDPPSDPKTQSFHFKVANAR